MGWFSSLFGGRKPQKDTATQKTVEVGVAHKPSLPASHTSPAKKPAASARRSSDDPRIKGWVNWNICGWVEVAGVQYRQQAALWAFKRAKEGDAFELTRDPENPHDVNAIKVSYQGRHVGFISRDLAARAAARFPADMPLRAEFISGWSGDTGYVRLTIQPLMPDAKSRKEGGWDISGRKKKQD